jgi:hypothetical protein
MQNRKKLAKLAELVVQEKTGEPANKKEKETIYAAIQ